MKAVRERKMPAYRRSLAGTLLAAREAVMAPLRPMLRAADVTEQQWRVLRVLSDEAALGGRGLAAAALLHPPSVTRILKELGERGLVERLVHPQDGRRSDAVITGAGLQLVRATSAHTMNMLDAYGKAFGAQRLTALIEEIRAFTESIAQFAPDE